MKAAYIFLRNLENRVQISFGLQAYHIPTDESQLASLARKMSIRAKSRQESIALLMAEFEKHTGFVSKLYQHLFSDERDQEADQQTLRQWDARRALEARFSPDLMQDFRFHDPERAYRFLKSLMEGPRALRPVSGFFKKYLLYCRTFLKDARGYRTPTVLLRTWCVFWRRPKRLRVCWICFTVNPIS